jgi:hypothetical protein
VKSILLIVAAIAAGLTLTGISTGSGDRQTLVPPPEAVAESFARELSERRYELAARYLSDGLRRSMGHEGLRAWFDPVRQRLGETNQVSADREWMDEESAAARAAIDSEHGTAVLHVRMTRERSLWKIAELPRDVPAGEHE